MSIILFLTMIGDITSLEPFSCDQPFGTMADRGFSVIRVVSIDFHTLYSTNRTKCRTMAVVTMFYWMSIGLIEKCQFYST